ncbi:MAG: hypothetical protein JW871_04015, partial [Endomicrobiales bacterium]|nr:hypothetical protein [Endomicrobiales bacterium]
SKSTSNELIELKSRVSGHQKQLEEKDNKINELTMKMDPMRQPLRTGKANVEVIVQCDLDTNRTYMDRGGYIALGKDGVTMIVMSSTRCSAKKMQDNQVLYKGVFDLDANDKSIGKPISHLSEAVIAQIAFSPTPKGSKVLKGKAICIFNSSVQIELEVPSQTMNEEKILIPNIKEAFKKGFKI